MTTPLRDVPNVQDPDLYDFLREIKDVVERLPTRRDIESRPSTVQVISGGGGGGSGQPGDFTPPPAVTNLDALASTKFIAIIWDPPAGSARISYTEIWRSTDTNLSNATYAGASPHAFFVDNVGVGSPLYYYWARHVRANVNDPVYGPYEGTVSAQTPPELDEILDLLEGQLSELQLVQTLNERINLIDTPGTGLVDGLSQEIIARQDGDQALSQQIENIVATGGAAVYVQPEPPVDDPPGTLQDGDRWFDSDDGNRPYVWDSGISDWLDVTDQRIVANIAAIQTIQTAIVDLAANKAEASVVTTLQSTVGSHTTMLQTHASVVDGVSGQYFVKIDANGNVSGYGLYADEEGSAFVVAADLFAVGKAGHADKPLFAVGQIGGVDTIVLNALTLVGDLSIKNAMIEDVAAEKLFALEGTIAEAIIGQGHITNLMIGNVIQSDTWNDVTKQGWRLSKDLGLFEGQGITIYDALGNPIFGSGTGFNLNWAHITGANKPADGATSNSITSGAAAPSGGNDGDLYYRTSPQGWWARIGGQWQLVGDRTAVNIAAGIANQGNLATLDSLAYSALTGSKPPVDATRNQITVGTGAPSGGIDGDLHHRTSNDSWYARISGTWRLVGDRTAANIAAGIQNQGNFATLNQINAANISTFMASAAIGTLYLAGQAVTIPSGRYTAGNSAALPVQPSWLTVQTLTFTSSGAPVSIFFALVMNNTSGTSSINFGFRLLRGGSEIYSAPRITLMNGSMPWCGVIQDTPGPGSVTYSLQASRTFNQGAGNASNRSIVAIETKR